MNDDAGSSCPFWNGCVSIIAKSATSLRTMYCSAGRFQFAIGALIIALVLPQ